MGNQARAAEEGTVHGAGPTCAQGPVLVWLSRMFLSQIFLVLPSESFPTPVRDSTMSLYHALSHQSYKSDKLGSSLTA